MHQPSLLVVDDEPSLRQLIGEAGEAAGFRTTVTDDGNSFSAALAIEDPDVVALDLGMPRLDGIELLRVLGRTRSRAAILIISGFDRRILETAFRMGEELGLYMAGPLEKPLRFDALTEVFRGLKTTRRAA